MSNFNPGTPMARHGPRYGDMIARQETCDTSKAEQSASARATAAGAPSVRTSRNARPDHHTPYSS
jgi:hypothetical protein